MAVDEILIAKFAKAHNLSKRQQDVLVALVSDPQATSEAIAAKVACSPATVNVHLSNILQKTGFKNRRDLIKQLSSQVTPGAVAQDRLRPTIVLVADDDAVFRRKVMGSLSTVAGDKIQIIECENGQEAMMHLSRAKRGEDSFPMPDMILLDLIMPQMNGLVALEKIKNDPELKNVPVVVFSSHAEKEAINSTYSLGSSSFILKPTEDAEIDQVVTLLLQYWGRFGRPPIR